MSALSDRRRIAVAFAALLVALFVILAITTGIGHGDVPDDAVAVVNGDEISKEDFEAALEQAAARQGLDKAPQPGDAQYEALRDEALGELLDIAWIENEAAERDIDASDREVQQQFEQTKNQNFPNERAYQRFLQQSGFTQEDVDQRVRLQILSQKIQQQVIEDAGDVSDDDIEDYYEENKQQFQQPELRDVRLILNKDRAKVEQAKARLEQDDSDASWKRVAKQLSTDAISKNRGGLRAAVTQGLLPEAADKAVFESEQGELVGPIETPSGAYLIEVVKVTPATTQPLSEIRDQLEQQLKGQRGQEVFSAFVSDYQSKWTDETVCAEGYVIDRCVNFERQAAPACTAEQAKTTGCPPPVVSTTPAPPGGSPAGSFGAAANAPQGPHPPGSGEAPGGGVPGGIPGGVPGGAPPGVPPG